MGIILNGNIGISGNIIISGKDIVLNGIIASSTNDNSNRYEQLDKTKTGLESWEDLWSQTADTAVYAYSQGNTNVSGTYENFSTDWIIRQGHSGMYDSATISSGDVYFKNENNDIVYVVRIYKDTDYRHGIQYGPSTSALTTAPLRKGRLNSSSPNGYFSFTDDSIFWRSVDQFGVYTLDWKVEGIPMNTVTKLEFNTWQTTASHSAYMYWYVQNDRPYPYSGFILGLHAGSDSSFWNTYDSTDTSVLSYDVNWSHTKNDAIKSYVKVPSGTADTGIQSGTFAFDKNWIIGQDASYSNANRQVYADIEFINSSNNPVYAIRIEPGATNITKMSRGPDLGNLTEVPRGSESSLNEPTGIYYFTDDSIEYRSESWVTDGISHSNSWIQTGIDVNSITGIRISNARAVMTTGSFAALRWYIWY